MNNFPPSVSPRTFTSVAIFVAYILMRDLTINEQNAVGEWFMLVGQVLSTNAAQAQVLEDRKTIDTTDDDIDTIKKTLAKMQKEIDKLKKD